MLSILLVFMSTFSWSLPDRAGVGVGSNLKSTPIEWGVFDFAHKDQIWSRYVGRVVLGSVAPGDNFTEDPYCRVENDQFVAYTSDSDFSCKFKGVDKKTKNRSYNVSISYKEFTLQMNNSCDELAIDVSIQNKEAFEKTKGFFSMHCQKAENGFDLLVGYSDNFKLQNSLLHESYGKNESFKTYNFIGAGKLSNTKDLLLNEFILVDQMYDKAPFPMTVSRRSFLTIRQSPFEVDLGAGLNQISFSGEDGSFSTTAIRGGMSIAYQFMGNFISRFDTQADIFAIDDSSKETNGTSYFFYDTQFLVGYRLGRVQQLEFLAGLSFAKYSYTIDVSRRLFTRQGFMAKLIYRKRYKEQSQYWVEAQFQQYEAADSSMGLKFGYRFFKSSKITPWLAYSQASLSDDALITNAQNDSGQSISLGVVLDF